MNEKQAQGIGDAVARLLRHAISHGLAPCGQPVDVELFDVAHVTFLGVTKGTGNDVNVRVGVEPSGRIVGAMRREWDDRAGEMGPWVRLGDLEGVTT